MENSFRTANNQKAIILSCTSNRLDKENLVSK